MVKSNIKPILIFAAFYFLVFIALIALIEIFNMELYHTGLPPGPTMSPSTGLLLMYVYIYLVPFILAIIAGIIFRPFWKTFFVLLIIIVFIHIFHGVAASIPRKAYLKELQQEAYMLNDSEVKLENFNYTFNEEGTGFLSWTLRTNSLEKGSYTINFWFGPGYRNRFGYFDFEITNEDNSTQEIKLKLRQSYMREHRGEELEIRAEILKRKQENKKVLRICGWSNLCPTYWDGFDSEINAYKIEKELDSNIILFETDGSF